MHTPLPSKSLLPAPRVPDAILDALGEFAAPVVITHVVPDADALGGMFALALAGPWDGRRVRVALPDGSLSQRLTFMLDWSKVTVATPDDFAAADGFVALDTAKVERCNVGEVLKGTDWSAGRPIINIDHHQTNTRFGDVNWVVDDAGSTCELIYHYLRAADRPIDAVTASLLYAGIHTDTLGFSLSTTSASALQAAADLVACGADVAELSPRLYRQRKSEFDLLRVVYANTRIVADGLIVYSFASYDEIKDAGCSAADIDDQISVPRSLAGARLALLFSEGNKGKTRINFRSANEISVLDLAARFKGGGHYHAAGAVLNCPLQEAIDQVIPRAVEHLAEHAEKKC